MLSLKGPPEIFDETRAYTKRHRNMESRGKDLLKEFCQSEVQKFLQVRADNHYNGIISGLSLDVPGLKIEDDVDQDDIAIHVSCFNLQHTNDIPGYLAKWRRRLKKNGQVIGFLFGGNSLKEFRQAWQLTEEKLLGGVSPRFSPLVQPFSVSQLLLRTHYALPIAYTHEFSVEYRHVTEIIEDIRSLGMGASLQSHPKNSLPRHFIDELQAHYQSHYGKNNRLPLTIDLICFSGFASLLAPDYYIQQGSVKRLSD